MAYVMTELCKEPSIPSFYYYNGILEGYRQNGLPLSKLKQAWQHCAKELDQESSRLNRICGGLLVLLGVLMATGSLGRLLALLN